MKFAYSVTYAFSDGGSQVIKHTCVWVDKEVQSKEDEDVLSGHVIKEETAGGLRRYVEVTLMWYSRLPGSDKAS